MYAFAFKKNTCKVQFTKCWEKGIRIGFNLKLKQLMEIVLQYGSNSNHNQVNTRMGAVLEIRWNAAANKIARSERVPGTTDEGLLFWSSG